MTNTIKQTLGEDIPGEDDTDVTADEFNSSFSDHVINYPDGSQRKWDEDGNEFWLDAQGEFHSDVGPAVIYSSGAILWYRHGKYHRVDGPAMVLPGAEYWYQNGKLHRDNGPAVIKDTGEYAWYQNGELHRSDGPAVTRSDGAEEWYVRGRRIHPVPGLPQPLRIVCAYTLWLYQMLSRRVEAAMHWCRVQHMIHIYKKESKRRQQWDRFMHSFRQWQEPQLTWADKHHQFYDR